MRVREIMTPNPVTMEASEPVVEAAQLMRRNEIGDVVVRDHGKVCGIVTDRDIVVRVLAEGKDPKTVNIGSVCSKDPLTVSPEEDASEAVRLMKEQAVRRLPVMHDGNLLGIVSLGDLAIALDRHSALGNISAADANNT